MRVYPIKVNQQRPGSSKKCPTSASRIRFGRGSRIGSRSSSAWGPWQTTTRPSSATGFKDAEYIEYGLMLAQ
jgi:arginine decarboxylase-like protein